MMIVVVTMIFLKYEISVDTVFLGMLTLGLSVLVTVIASTASCRAWVLLKMNWRGRMWPVLEFFFSFIFSSVFLDGVLLFT